MQSLECLPASDPGRENGMRAQAARDSLPHLAASNLVGSPAQDVAHTRRNGTLDAREKFHTSYKDIFEASREKR